MPKSRSRSRFSWKNEIGGVPVWGVAVAIVAVLGMLAAPAVVNATTPAAAPYVRPSDAFDEPAPETDPTAQPLRTLLSHSFTTGIPEGWTLTGPGVETLSADGGLLASPDAVTYVVARLPERPTVVAVRNTWTGIAGPTFAVLADQPEFDIDTWSGAHIQTSNDYINGWLAVPASEGGPTQIPEQTAPSAPYELEMGVEYETRGVFDYDAGRYTITVTRVIDSAQIASVSYIADIGARIPPGPTQLMIEPGANVTYSSVEAAAP